MATFTRDAKGFGRIQWVQGIGPDARRMTVRLGKVKDKYGRTFLSRVEAVLEARGLNESIDPATAAWFGKLSDRLYARVARTGILPPRGKREAATVGGLLAAWLAALDVKPTTRVRAEQAKRALVEHFGEAHPADSIDVAAAEAWRAKLRADNYAQATVSRTVLYVRQAWRWAGKRGLVKGNPFAEVKAGSQQNAARQAFIDRATIAKVIDAAPDVEWRLLIVLSRFGGLRVPSEALALKWTDVDWAGMRMKVHSRKTEHHEGGGVRSVPIFPEVAEHLQRAFEQAPDGAVFVIGRYREGCNLNPQLRRIVKRAGVAQWPRTWHNLRASRQTELATSFPLATVCAWIGNTKAIAGGHYLQTTDADWQRATGLGEAAQNPAQPTSETTGKGRKSGAPEGAEVPALQGVSDPCGSEQNQEVGRAGLEPATPAFSMRCSTN